MSYVRRIIAEEQHENFLVRRYEVETPVPDDYWSMHRDELAMFDRLVELELHIGARAAEYFERAPYALGEEIWTSTLVSTYDGWCLEPWWRFTTTVLWYRKEAIFFTMESREHWGGGPLPIDVDLWDENHLLFGTKHWKRRNQIFNAEIGYWRREGEVVTEEEERKIREEIEEEKRRREWENEEKLRRKSKLGKYLANDHRR